MKFIDVLSVWGDRIHGVQCTKKYDSVLVYMKANSPEIAATHI